MIKKFIRWHQKNPFKTIHQYHHDVYHVYNIQSISYNLLCASGIKKSLVLVPGTSWISGRTSIYFHPMSGGQVKKLNASIFFLDKDKLFGNRTSKNFDAFARGTSEKFLIFLPLSAWTIGMQLMIRSVKCMSHVESLTICIINVTIYYPCVCINHVWCSLPLFFCLYCQKSCV